MRDMRLAERMFRWSLRSFPPEFRARHGRAMRDVFTAQWEERGSGPLLARVGFLAWLMFDTTWSGVRERMGTVVKLGHLKQQRDASPGRPPLRPPFLDGVLADLRYGVRLLRANPVVSVAAIASLAFGIGAATTFFTAANAVMLRPLPYPDSDRLVTIYEGNPVLSGEQICCGLAAAEYLDWRSQEQLFDGMAVTTTSTRDFRTATSTAELNVQSLSASFLPLLGADASIGRIFVPEDDEPGAQPVAILGHGFWQRQFGGDPGVLGTSVRLNDLNHTVIGVLPENANLLRSPSWTANGKEIDVFLNVGSWQSARSIIGPTNREYHGLLVIARLAPGVTVERADQEMTAIQHRNNREYPHFQQQDEDPTFYDQANAAQRVVLKSLRDDLRESYSIPVLLPLATAALILLIACSNVATLLLARSAARRGEFSVRAAMGASKSRLFRQVVAEVTVLGALGGGLGLLFAHWGLEVVAPMISERLVLQFSGLTAEPSRPFEQLSLDWMALAFSVGVSLVTVALFGLAPAILASQTEVGQALKGGSLVLRDRRDRWFQDAFIVGQIALAVVLLVGSGLMANTMVRIARIDSGVDLGQMLSVRFRLPMAKYFEQSAITWQDGSTGRGLKALPERELFFEELMATFERMPEVESAMVLAWDDRTNFTVRGWPEDRQPRRAPEVPRTYTLYMRGDYVGTTGTALLRGTAPDAWRPPGEATEALVDENLVGQYFGGEDPIGAVLEFGWRDPVTIVGVMPESRYMSAWLFGEDISRIWFLGTPDTYPNRWAFVSIRTATRDPLSVAGAIREAIRSIDPSFTLSIESAQQTFYGEAFDELWFFMLVLASFSMMALLLTLVGVYGVTHVAVTRRTRELGIRIALGAQPENVIWSVAARVLGLTVVGIMIGGAVALVATRVLESLLYGVTPSDPATYIGTLTLLLIAALIASLIPALRATRIDPVEAIRAL